MQYVAADRPFSGHRDLPPPPDPADLIADLGRGILRRWRLVLLIAAVLVGAVYVLMQARPDIYEIEARLLVKIGPENLEVPATVSRGAMVSSGVRKEDINSDVILLQSRHLVEHAVDTLGIAAFRVERPRPTTLVGWIRRGAGTAARALSDAAEAALVALRLQKALSERDELVLKIADNLIVRREGESDVIVLSLEFGNAARAVDVLNLIVDRFLTDRAAARRTPGTVAFFEEQVTLARARVEEIDVRLNDLRARYQLTSVAEERELLLGRAAEVRTATLDAEQARESVAPLRPMAEALDPRRMVPIMGGSTWEDVRDAISDLMVQRTADVGEISATGRAARELEEKIGALVLLLDKTVAQELVKREAEAAAIEARLSELNVAEQALLLMMSERETMQNRFDDFATRLEEERVNARMQETRVANVAVLAAPALPLEPAGPARLMTSVVSIPLGLVLGVLVAALMAWADPRLMTAREAARIPGLTLLGEMPRRPGGRG